MYVPCECSLFSHSTLGRPKDLCLRSTRIALVSEWMCSYHTRLLMTTQTEKEDRNVGKGHVHRCLHHAVAFGE